MMIELSIRKTGEEVMRYFLNKETTAIGRSTRNDICLPDASISRTHLLIVRKGDQFIATDKSTNGTFVNDEKISSQELRIDDMIKLGQWTIHFGVSKEVSEIKTEITERDPTRVLSFRPEKAELVCERAMLELFSPSKRLFTVTKSIVSIGKSKTNDIVLEDEYISNYHCKIENRKGMFFLKDLQSTNGTILNGQRVIETSLPFGSTIEIGKLRLRFFSTEEIQTVRASTESEFEGIHSQHAKMREIFTLIDRIASSNATVLIHGETGTGKELIARAVHNRSDREKKPFVALNCGAISKDLIESELFGHEKGAFTSAHQQRKGVFEQAQGGTLFLDEIGELPLDLQPKLLRVLEAGEIKRVGGSQLIDVDVRVVAATHRDLAQDVRNGRFREDLFFRLYVVPIKLPPLRERPQDISLLVGHFLAIEFAGTGKRKSIDRSAIDVLVDYPWPGNIRELKNVIGRAVLDCKTPTISAGDLQFSPLGIRDQTRHEGGEHSLKPFSRTLKDVEKEKILTELKRNNWNKKATAKVLGIAKSTLHEKIKKYGIEDD